MGKLPVSLEALLTVEVSVNASQLPGANLNLDLDGVGMKEGVFLAEHGAGWFAPLGSSLDFLLPLAGC